MDKEKVKQLKNKLEGGQRNSVQWRPEEGKNLIRIIPNKFEKETNFQGVKFHYGIGNRSIVCLKNFGENCPVCNFVGKLFDSDDETLNERAKKIMAKERYYTPIVVRKVNKEGKIVDTDGPYWFGISYTNLKTLLNFFEDFGDYTDVEKGYDFIVRYTKKQPFPETLISIEKQKPLSDDPDEVEKFIDNVTNIVDSFENFKMTEEQVKERLTSFLDGDSVTNEAKEEEEVKDKDEDLKTKLDRALKGEDKG